VHAARQAGEQHDLPRDGARRHRGHHLTEDQLVELVGVEVVPLHQFLNDDATEIECGQIVEDGVGLHERGPQTSDDRDAPSALRHANLRVNLHRGE
jgi:hypothetical protein